MFPSTATQLEGREAGGGWKEGGNGVEGWRDDGGMEVREEGRDKCVQCVSRRENDECGMKMQDKDIGNNCEGKCEVIVIVCLSVCVCLSLC